MTGRCIIRGHAVVSALADGRDSIVNWAHRTSTVGVSVQTLRPSRACVIYAGGGGS